MICNDCIKKEVCKYKEVLEKFEEDKEYDDIPEFIRVEYSCKYKHNSQILNYKK